MVQIVKNTDKSAFIDFSFIDKEMIKTGKIKELIAKVKADKKLSGLI